MMKRKKTLLFLGIALVAVIGGIVAEHLIQAHVDKVNTVDEEVLTVDADSLTEITVTADGNTLTFENTDGTWTLSGDDSFPVDQDKLAEFIEAFASVHASFSIEDVEDYGQYGLKNPTGSVTFTYGDDSDTISFGDFSTMDEKRYICINDENVYLIDTDLMEEVSGSQDDYLANGSIPEYAELDSVTATGASEFTVSYEPDADYSYSEEFDYYAQGESPIALSTDKVNSYVDSIRSLDLTNYVTYSADADTLSDYGFDSPDLTVTVSGQVASEEDDNATEEASVTVSFVKKDDDTVYAHFDDSSVIYQIDADAYETLAAKGVDDLRPSELISADLSQVAAISCTIEGETYNISVDYAGYGDGSFLLGEESLDLESAAGSLLALSTSEGGSDYATGTEELSYTVTLNDDAGTVISVALYRYDGDSCVASVDGQVIGLVARSDMASVREAMLAAILNAGKETGDQAQ